MPIVNWDVIRHGFAVDGSGVECPGELQVRVLTG